MKLPQTRKRIISLIVAVILVLSCIVVYFYITKYQEILPTVTSSGPECAATVKFYNKKMVYHGDAVTSNGPECAAIGMDILKNQNGTAVDAMIATLFCEGVAVTQSSGLGGGFVATIYDKESGTVETIVARERAPIASNVNMFVNMTTVDGILSIAVPGELKGYAEMHKRYGRTPWKTLIQPTINLCRSGHLVTEYLGRILQGEEEEIQNSPSLREVFVNPNTGKVWRAGDRIKREKLAETLEIIAEEGADSMYSVNGTIAKRLIEEFEKLDGLITMEDLTSYETSWQKPVTTKLRGNYTLNTVPLPASGMVLSLILNILNGYETSMSVPYLHKMAESFKYGYARRSFLGDETYNETFLEEFSNMNYANKIRELISNNNKTFNNFEHYGANYTIKDDHGTAHLSVLSKNGDAISVTTTINNIFGSKVRSQSTGIILNDQMDDFSTPGKPNQFGVEPSPANYIKPGKRPLSSMCPLIVIDGNGDAVFIAGSAGGSKITTTVAYVLARHLWMKESLKDAVLARRVHHQLLPMNLFYEDGLDTSLVNGLKVFGHKTVGDKSLLGFAALTAISRVSGHIEVTFDPRRIGSTEIY